MAVSSTYSLNTLVINDVKYKDTRTVMAAFDLIFAFCVMGFFVWTFGTELSQYFSATTGVQSITGDVTWLAAVGVLCALSIAMIVTSALQLR